MLDCKEVPAMIYIPMLKTRGEELRIIKEMKFCFSDKIIPLIEIINEKYETVYKKDSNGEFILQKHNNRKYKVKEVPTEKDIITLPYIDEIVNHSLVFIDYFRFSLTKYGRNIDFNKAELSFNLNNDFNLYKKKLSDITQYDNMIPVISVKPEFEIPKSELMALVTNLQAKSQHIALRITEEWIDKYEDVIKKLREMDYLLFDVEEQNPELKFMEIQALEDMRAACKIALLNSPRKSSIRNGEYPEHDKTDLINNCARMVADSNNWAGYGDYCGLKDMMPTHDGSNGTGAALALLFDYEQNVFYSFCNHDTSLGMAGYRSLLPIIKADESFLNPLGDCPGYRRIHAMTGTGNWNTWHHINVARYIFQTYKNL